MRARCKAFRYCPAPLGIVTAEHLNKLELRARILYLVLFLLFNFDFNLDFNIVKVYN